MAYTPVQQRIPDVYDVDLSCVAYRSSPSIASGLLFLPILPASVAILRAAPIEKPDARHTSCTADGRDTFAPALHIRTCAVHYRIRRLHRPPMDAVPASTNPTVSSVWTIRAWPHALCRIALPHPALHARFSSIPSDRHDLAVPVYEG